MTMLPSPAPSFVHLHVHSHYSMMWGVSSVEALCRAAAAAGFEYLALTDTNGFYGLINFLEAARKHRIRPIVGAHIETPTEAAVILAKTVRGYELISDLITRRHLNENFSLIRDFPNNSNDNPSGNSVHNSGDLAVLSSDPAVIDALRSRAECWFEVVPGSSGRRALQIARDLDVPPVATNRVYFVHPDDYSLHRLVRAIDFNRTMSTLPPGEIVQPGQWLKSEEEMAAHFPHCPEALANTVQLAASCRTEWDQFQTVFPHYRDRHDDHFALLLEECRKGISWRYGQNGGPIEKRLWEELELIKSKGYVDYFLVVADIVRRHPIHCGRGSAAASLVSYLLGITHVDPIRHNLLFGRFLNPHRQDHPDIDVDFPWDERDDLLEELRRYYGPERLASVSNHVGFGARASVREVAKVYGMPAAEIKEVTRRMSFWTHPARIWERVESHPKFRGFLLAPPWPEIIGMAARLESLPRHLSVHCGGIILVPDRISRYVPSERSAKGVRIIQWEKDQAEKAGLVKIDLLGNRSLAVIRDALAAIEKNTGKRLDYASLNPIDDPSAVELIKRGDTMGVFYVESPAMRQLQQKTRRGDFEHLVIHSSIIRPAANRYIREYVHRLHGEPYEPLHPRLKELLAETYGILVYQEDVVRVAMALAGFGWAEADGLRKVLSKKSAEQISNYRRRFYEGCARRNVSANVMDAIWDMFTSFAGYSFCKPHSASYALVSFKSAYLKAHYPAEFMAAVLSNGGGYYSTFAYTSEARRMGITVVGPDVNESDWNHKGKGKSIRMGLQQLQNIRRGALDAILDERNKNGIFLSIEDFLRRVSLTLADGSILVKSGSLDSLAGRLNRPQLLWFVESWLNGQSFFRHGTKQQVKAAPHLRIPVSIRVPPLPDLNRRQEWQQEMDSLGLVLSVHPLAMVEPSVGTLPHRVVPASELARHVGHRVWVLGWPITRKEVLTREGKPMEFVSFEDETAIYETVFFPETFQRFCQELDMGRAYLLFGLVESEFGAVSLTVHQLRKYQPNHERFIACSLHSHSPITSRSLRTDSSRSGKRSRERVRPFLEG
jgi:DNA-directed DNA polymerase III PolC